MIKFNAGLIELADSNTIFIESFSAIQNEFKILTNGLFSGQNLTNITISEILCCKNTLEANSLPIEFKNF